MRPLALFLTFLLVPVLEIYLMFQVGHAIGGWPTVGLLLAGTALGAWVIRHEGRRAWRALRAAVASGAMPDRELGDAAMVLTGGVLLLTPGFITDAAGLLFVLPFTRPLVRRGLARYFARRISIAQGAPPRQERVVRGEVITEERKDG